MQHHRKKVLPSTIQEHHQLLSAQQARYIVQQNQITQYRTVVDHCLSLRMNNIVNESALSSTTTVLSHNPEFYSLWNYRRTIILSFDAIQQISQLHQDLNWLISTILPINPKSYWIWNHRRWCLQLLSSILSSSSSSNTTTNDCVELWQKELVLVNQFHNLDPRNFHAWGYRQYVIQQLISFYSTAESITSLINSEFNYTSKKISSSINNYSAWHIRSTLLLSWLSHNDITLDKVLSNELDMLHNAMYTDPTSQSHWLYHRWLMTKAKLDLSWDFLLPIIQDEICLVQELEGEEPDCKWVTGCLACLYDLIGDHTNKRKAVTKLLTIDPDRVGYYTSLLNGE